MGKHDDAERRYAQIEGERDYHKKRADRLKDERDALAAQVRKAQIIAARWEGNDDNIGQTLTALEIWATRADHDPGGELARLKAQWQAEALELFASSIRSENDEGRSADLYGMAGLMEVSASQFRRQAEEDNDD